MEERQKSPMEMAAYNAGMELARRRKLEAEEKQDVQKKQTAKDEPAVVYLPSTNSYQNTKASLN